jgi:hypothetical protein
LLHPVNLVNPVEKERPSCGAAVFFISPCVRRKQTVLEAIVIIFGLLLLGLVFYPRKPGYTRRVTRSFNGRRRGHDLEKY